VSNEVGSHENLAAGGGDKIWTMSEVVIVLKFAFDIFSLLHATIFIENVRTHVSFISTEQQLNRE